MVKGKCYFALSVLSIKFTPNQGRRAPRLSLAIIFRAFGASIRTHYALRSIPLAMRLRLCGRHTPHGTYLFFKCLTNQR